MIYIFYKPNFHIKIKLTTGRCLTCRNQESKTKLSHKVTNHYKNNIFELCFVLK